MVNRNIFTSSKNIHNSLSNTADDGQNLSYNTTLLLSLCGVYKMVFDCKKYIQGFLIQLFLHLSLEDALQLCN